MSKAGKSSAQSTTDFARHWPARSDEDKNTEISLLAPEYAAKLSVDRCFEYDPAVYLLISALKKYGCVFRKQDVNIHDRLSEDERGFNHDKKQIDIQRQNAVSITDANNECLQIKKGLLRAFDDCRTKFNPKSISHQACTEIRAATLFDCYRRPDFFSDFRSLNHQKCVKVVALTNICKLGVPADRGVKTIDKVFDQCYNDREPMGRIFREGSKDYALSLLDGVYYGYIKSKDINKTEWK